MYIYNKIYIYIYKISFLEETQYLLKIFQYIPLSALATPPVEDVDLDDGKAPDYSSSTTPPPVDKPSGLPEDAPSPTQSHSSLNEEKAESVKSLSKSNTQSPRGDLSSFFGLHILIALVKSPLVTK